MGRDESPAELLVQKIVGAMTNQQCFTLSDQSEPNRSGVIFRPLNPVCSAGALDDLRLKYNMLMNVIDPGR